MGFWAQPARHIYVIPENEKPATVLLSSSSDETVEQVIEPKEKRAAGAPDTLILLGIEKKVDEINAKVTKCMKPSAEVIPASMKTAVQNSFPCRICLKKPLDEPPMVASCCQAIIGCETCVAACFGDDEVKDCPQLSHRWSPGKNLCHSWPGRVLLQSESLSSHGGGVVFWVTGSYGKACCSCCRNHHR